MLLAIVPGGHALHWLEPAVDIMPARQLLHAVAAAVAEYLLEAHGWQLDEAAVAASGAGNTGTASGRVEASDAGGTDGSAHCNRVGTGCNRGGEVASATTHTGSGA